jgi:hypothetical protein
LPQIRPALGYIIQSADARQQSVIVRPRAPTQLIQLDDLNEVTRKWVQPLAFLTIRTSLGRYQSWLAMENADADLVRRIKIGCGADTTASGATRLADTRNFKRKYAPNFPIVRLVHVAPGRTVTREQFAEAGLVAEPERSRPSFVQRVRRGWPDYQRYLTGTPMNHSGDHPDVSRADFTWAIIALDFGNSVEATAAELMRVSTKAKTDGEQYALRTAYRAFDALQERGHTVLSRPR